MYQISLLAAFIAGMVALFAPCCITYLFPAYIGNVFKERTHVIGMTLVYSMGIFVVMLPVVLGAKFLSNLFFSLHDYTYVVGGFIMIIVGVLTLLGIKLPLHFTFHQKKNTNDIASTFTLGVFSGITSACCAPVLIGVMTLSAVSPSLLLSLGVGASYVLGMVTPLYVASFFIHKKNLLANPLLKKKVSTIVFLGNSYAIFMSNIVAFAVFVVTGILMIMFTLTGNLSMDMGEVAVTKQINQVTLTVTEFVRTVPGLDAVFIVLVGYGLYKFVKTQKHTKV
jgi:cytochrome c biogenesis protein CcdA